MTQVEFPEAAVVARSLSAGRGGYGVRKVQSRLRHMYVPWRLENWPKVAEEWTLDALHEGFARLRLP